MAVRAAIGVVLASRAKAVRILEADLIGIESKSLDKPFFRLIPLVKRLKYRKEKKNKRMNVRTIVYRIGWSRKKGKPLITTW